MESYFEKLNSQYKAIKDRLMDEESIKLFDIRMEYAITRDLEKLENILFDKGQEWRCMELELFLERFPEKREIVLFGAGKVGKRTKKYLNVCGYFPSCFCDNYMSACKIEGIPVISVDEFIENYRDSILIICSDIYGKEMYDQVVSKKYPEENILLPGAGYIQIHCGRQYFDLFRPKQKEIFIDAGGYDGSTVRDFLSWVGESGGEGKCYSLEPVPEMYRKMVECCKKRQWKNVIVCNCAAWDKEDSVLLTRDQNVNGVIWGGSRVCENGETVVKGRTIDAICAKEKQITFIKMDIEGSELKALHGAKETILHHKPRLAISVYHKPEDIYEIPGYILSLVPEYKIYIRQYAADLTETILYAEV